MTAGGSSMTGLFLRAKAKLREVPGLSDQQVLAALGFNQTVVSWGYAAGMPLDVVRQARRDLEAGDL